VARTPSEEQTRNLEDHDRERYGDGQRPDPPYVLAEHATPLLHVFGPTNERDLQTIVLLRQSVKFSRYRLTAGDVYDRTVNIAYPRHVSKLSWARTRAKT
jgi:hypothetical protein